MAQRVGRPIQAINCPHCGAENEDYRKTCAQCGRSLAQIGKSPPKTSSSSNAGGLVVLALLICAGLAFAMAVNNGLISSGSYQQERESSRRNTVSQAEVTPSLPGLVSLTLSQSPNHKIRVNSGEEFTISLYVTPRFLGYSTYHGAVRFNVEGRVDSGLELVSHSIEPPFDPLLINFSESPSNSSSDYQFKVNCTGSRSCFDPALGGKKYLFATLTFKNNYKYSSKYKASDAREGKYWRNILTNLDVTYPASGPSMIRGKADISRNNTQVIPFPDEDEFPVDEE
jgi:hypothetical protein